MSFAVRRLTEIVHLSTGPMFRNGMKLRHVEPSTEKIYPGGKTKEQNTDAWRTKGPDA
jgi:hypothetical protein